VSSMSGPWGRDALGPAGVKPGVETKNPAGVSRRRGFDECSVPYGASLTATSTTTTRTFCLNGVMGLMA